MRNIKIIEVNSEIGAGTRGASLGIDAMKIAALDFMSGFFKTHPSVAVETENDLLYDVVSNPYAKRINGVLKVYERLSAAIVSCVKEGAFPLVLSGDHSSAGGTIAGLKAAHPKKRLGAIWIDAHADLHTPYTTPSGNMHGMPVAATLALDNKESAINKLDKHTLESWENLKNVGGNSQKILPEDVVFIALRDYELQEEALLKQHNMKVFPISEIRKKGIEFVARQSMLHLKDCDQVYISFDVDSLDSGISRGTGTPVPNGLKEKEAEDLLAALAHNQKICCLEITEVNPTLDKENLMAEIAFNIMQRAMNILMLN